MSFKLIVIRGNTLCVAVRPEPALRYLLVRKSLHNMSETKLSVDLGSMRTQYRKKTEFFLETNLISKEPIAQFQCWFEEAQACDRILEPNAMCLSTCPKSGFPSARFVLLKGYGQDGFKFFTNYSSRKARELNENSNAALTFYWEVLNRSVRIEGTVQKLSEEEAVHYFHSRPRDSQVGTACSNQSQPISSRKILCQREKEFKEKYANNELIPKPKDWGGYILKPHFIEFWQGQSDRLHDRICFRLPKEGDVIDNDLLHQGDDGWVYERLQP